jgi:hypothetical protein
MAEQPCVQGLHAAEVRNLDEFRMPRLRVHRAAPQDQGTTVLAGPETIALLHYPDRRRQREGGPPTVGRMRLASRQMKTSASGFSMPSSCWLLLGGTTRLRSGRVTAATLPGSPKSRSIRLRGLPVLSPTNRPCLIESGPLSPWSQLTWPACSSAST